MSAIVTPEWPYCSYPLLVEVYSLCDFNCLYCFTKHKESWHNKAVKRKIRGFDEKKDMADVDSFERILHGGAPLNKTQRLLKAFLYERIAIQIGGQTEPAGNLELKYHRTKALLQILKHAGNNYPVRISVKGTAFMSDEYLRIFEGYTSASVLISIISADERKVSKIERGAPSVRDRLRLAKALSEKGVKLGLRLRPIIPRFTKATLEQLLHDAKNSGFHWVTVEWLRLPRTMTKATFQNYEKLSDIVGFDIVDFYKKHSDSHGDKNGVLRLQRDATKDLYGDILRLGKSLGLRIASCNKDYRCVKTFTPNCCGVPLTDRHWNRMQLSYAVHIAKKKRRVFLRDVLDKDSPLFSIMNRDNDGGKYSDLSYGETLIKIWNTPSHRHYPARFFPELEFVGKDRKGNHVFAYNE